MELLASNDHQVINVDMGIVNSTPFLLRVNLGIMAAMVTDADRDMKNNIGQLAYGITALKAVAHAESIRYSLTLDGEELIAQGVSLTVTNSGNMGVGDFTLQPGISITDGLLDVILMKDNSLTSILKIAGSTLLQQNTEALQHWKVKKVVISMDSEQAFICDDIEMRADKLNIEVAPGSIKILVPAEVQ
ncbi:diacylglycerol/lipid kinase family protein [Mucilaginibacter terrae]|uniref:diacylglycerol/lipid kinase family protein n=1 Tax=Mucilaginibacter terrae TaxID=1955052 RepID=UPI0036331954